jgi:putative hemolysin
MDGNSNSPWQGLRNLFGKGSDPDDDVHRSRQEDEEEIFDDKMAYEIMTPRTEVFMIDADEPFQDYVEELMELHYTRIPVYENDIDNIIGILNIKDLFISTWDKGFENVKIREILRKPYFVPETKHIASLFRDLQASKQHIAVLIDEYGGFSGIVTMEDIIEEVVGEIGDEYDEEETPVQKIGDNCYLLDGLLSLNDINEMLGLSLESEDSETLGGYLLDILDELPEDGEDLDLQMEQDGCRFTILAVKDRHVDLVKLEILPEHSGKEEA